METHAHNREGLDPISPALDDGTATTVGGDSEQKGLSRGAIGLTGVTMQSITTIAPAIAAFFFTAVIVGFVGITAPLAYVVAIIIVLMLGSSLVQLSKHLPSAGGYYTYISRAIHPRAGFLTSWMYLFYAPLVAATAW